jgi:hypothetical protein
MSHSMTSMGAPSVSMRPEHGTWPGRRRASQCGIISSAALASLSQSHILIAGRIASKQYLGISMTTYCPFMICHVLGH